jgi:hypothetical protein
MKIKNKKQLLIAACIAAAAGFIARLFFDSQLASVIFSVMSLSFLLGAPMAMGFLTVYIAEREKIHGLAFAIFTPWISILILFLVTIIASFEGWACWLMILPVFLIFASLGGLWAHRVRKRKNSNRNNLQLSLAVLLPFIIAPVEHFIGQSTQSYRAYTEIEIHATKEQIWGNVTRVRPIKLQQDSAYFTRFLGFPRPIRAELDTDAVGGKRKAIFDRGLIFDERVIAYQPYKLMVFTIHANPFQIPSTTMDRHILVGGEFFDVLNGTYQLEPLGNNNYKLRLYSNFKLHTTFNFYADIWAGWIMKDIQQNILKVIKQRSESKT